MPVVFFLVAMVSLGRKVDEVDKDSLNFDLLFEEEDIAVDGKTLYNQM